MKRTSAEKFARRAIATLAVALLSCRIAGAADEFPDVTAAARPLADGVPQVAVVRLRELLTHDLSPAEASAARQKLAEALIDAGQPQKALELLDGAAQDSSEVEFLRAQALASLERWEEALPAYHRVAEDSASPVHDDAKMGEAESFRALGRADDALRTLASLQRVPRWRVRAQLRSAGLLIDRHDTAGATRIMGATQAKSISEKKEKRYLRARLEAALGHREKATELFGTILQKPEGASYAVLVAALFALADAHRKLNTPEAGDDALENFIDHYGTSAGLAPVFAKLDQLYAMERKPSRRELARWANDPAQPRRALAQWYLARADTRAGRRDDALRIFAQLRESHPTLPPLAEAYLQFAELVADDRRFDEAISILDDALVLRPERALEERIKMMTGEIHYRAGQWEAAARTFDEQARNRPAVAADALFNASAAWLQLKDNVRFVADSDALNAAGADEATRGDLVLEAGLVQAAQGDKRATDSLQAFVRDFPRHQRVSEALVALAELSFHAAPPRIAEAQKYLERAAGSQPTALANERADYLRIWIADATPDPDKPSVIALSTQFLERYPESAVAGDVRMKLAEASYRRHDFANAQTQFELLAQKNPNGAYTEKALFFAAESALQSMGADSLDRALVLLDDVVKRGGELKWAARNEQAATERKLGKPNDALTLYDEVLKGDAKPGDKWEALCGKADISYDMGANDRAKYPAAMELYEQLASAAQASPHWRNQALFKAAMCLEKLDDRPRALEMFYKVIEGENRPGKSAEYFWFYKAGFNAARLLEDDSKWDQAASVYEKLASSAGDRSEEAKSRLARLRLEHFLWDR
ncbi:MAG: tetratricopeptide repeat protein [Verrucomicrobiota bacterium]|nr:tetratricopeptide repeat protein [Verrucomicrobiota bacterium]